MNPKRRSSIAIALTLISIGLWFFAVQWMPELWAWAYGRYTWPIPIMGIGGVLLLIGILTGIPALAVPACIVGGIGGLLYWQNITGNWASWAYAWALIPGFVGVGIMLSGLLSAKRQAIVGGGWLLVISLVTFTFFGSFLGGWGLISNYWPILLIVLGILLLGQSFFRSR